MLRDRQTKQRTGFTLVEILVVIAIIAILIALTAPALMRYLVRGSAVSNTSVLKQLETSLENFKQKFQIYPPSRIKLAPIRALYGNTQFDQESLAVLNAIWQRLSTPQRTGFPSFMAANPQQGIDWTGGQGMTAAGKTNAQRIVTLEGDQCLVFFLGGIPGANPASCRGFSTDPTNPALTTGDRVGPFFDFKADRLYARTVGPVNFTASPTVPLLHGTNGYGFYSYRDSISDAKRPVPYLYFSAGRGTAGYHGMMLSIFISNGRQLPAVMSPASGGHPSDCASLFVSPYAEAMTMPPGTGVPATTTPVPRYHNPNTFQLISAGADGKFGSGTVLGARNALPPYNANIFSTTNVPVGYPTWNPASGLAGPPPAPTGTTDWADDQTNFHPDVLSARGT